MHFFRENGMMRSSETILLISFMEQGGDRMSFRRHAALIGAALLAQRKIVRFLKNSSR